MSIPKIDRYWKLQIASATMLGRCQSSRKYGKLSVAMNQYAAALRLQRWAIQHV